MDIQVHEREAWIKYLPFANEITTHGCGDGHFAFLSFTSKSRKKMQRISKCGGKAAPPVGRKNESEKVQGKKVPYLVFIDPYAFHYKLHQGSCLNYVYIFLYIIFSFGRKF